MNTYTRNMALRALLGNLFIGFILVVIWALLVKFIPAGGWLTAVHIVGFLSTIVIIGLGSLQSLRMLMRPIFAWLLAPLIWVIMAVVIRSFILRLLGVI